MLVSYLVFTSILLLHTAVMDCCHQPRNRTTRTMIMVRKNLFPNRATRFQILNWNIFCHLQREGEKVRGRDRGREERQR